MSKPSWVNSGHHWAATLIGEPWTREHDCWWLVRKVFAERYSIDLPPVRIGDMGDVENVAAIKSASAESGWRPAKGDPKDGDIVLMRDITGARHVGVMIATRRGLRLLHSVGHMTAHGPVGEVASQPLAEAIRSGPYTEVETWRRAN